MVHKLLEVRVVFFSVFMTTSLELDGYLLMSSLGHLIQMFYIDRNPENLTIGFGAC